MTKQPRLYLTLVGIIALSFLVTPFILYSIGMVTALLVLVAMILLRLTRNQSLKTFPKVFKRFVWMKHDIEKELRGIARLLLADQVTGINTKTK